MKDTADNRAILVRLSEKNSSIIPVSFRWVLDCASKRQFIQPDQNFIYRPLQFKTPLKDFHKLIFEVVGVDDGLRLKIKELVGVLGSLKMTPNKSELTHCLCGEQYLTSSKIT